MRSHKTPSWPGVRGHGTVRKIWRERRDDRYVPRSGRMPWAGRDVRDYDRTTPRRNPIHVFKYWLRIERRSRHILMPSKGPWRIAEITRELRRGILAGHKTTGHCPLKAVFFDCHLRDFDLAMQQMPDDSWLHENRMYTARLVPKYRQHLRTLYGSTTPPPTAENVAHAHNTMRSPGNFDEHNQTRV